MKWLAKRLLGKAMGVSVCAMVLGLVEGHAGGQCVEHKILPSDVGEIDVFGQSVSICGSPGNEVAIIGAVENDSAYIYRNSGENWMQEQKLVSFGSQSGFGFGQSVSISGPPGNEVVIIGEFHGINNHQNTGAAYIFRFDPDTSGWIEEARLVASDGTFADNFGFYVSISGSPGNEIAIVGARGDNDNGTNSGSAYIYRFNPDTSNWVEEQKLLPSDGAAEDRFGSLLSISGIPGNEIAIVGAWGHDDNGSNSGSAYIYRYDPGLLGWVQETKLLASDGAAGDLFGLAVSISGIPGNEVAIVGAYRDDDNGIDSGSAYIYRKIGAIWIEEAKLLATDGAEGDAFGASTLISGMPGKEVAIVGAPWDNDNGTKSGSVYIYHKNR